MRAEYDPVPPSGPITRDEWTFIFGMAALLFLATVLHG